MSCIWTHRSNSDERALRVIVLHKHPNFPGMEGPRFFFLVNSLWILCDTHVSMETSSYLRCGQVSSWCWLQVCLSSSGSNQNLTLFPWTCSSDSAIFGSSPSDAPAVAERRQPPWFVRDAARCYSNSQTLAGGSRLQPGGPINEIKKAERLRNKQYYIQFVYLNSVYKTTRLWYTIRCTSQNI